MRALTTFGKIILSGVLLIAAVFLLSVFSNHAKAEARTLKAIESDLCEAFARVQIADERIEHEKEIAKISGVVDRETLHRNGALFIRHKKRGLRTRSRI